MMRDLSIAKELRQHGEGTGGQGLVDERLLSCKGLHDRAAGQLIFAGVCVDNFRVELGNGDIVPSWAASIFSQTLTCSPD